MTAALAEDWPSTLWVYAASGVFCVMRHDENGERAVTCDGGYDWDYTAASIDIPCDGGDW